MSRGVNYDTTSELTSNVAHIFEDLVVSGGNASLVRVWRLNGEVHSELNADASNVYSIAVREKSGDQKPLMAMAGTSPRINICANFLYNDFYFEVD